VTGGGESTGRRKIYLTGWDDPRQERKASKPIGRTEITMMAMTTKLKFSFTNGSPPKK
jgi:hypothetical protein